MNKCNFLEAMDACFAIKCFSGLKEYKLWFIRYTVNLSAILDFSQITDASSIAFNVHMLKVASGKFCVHLTLVSQNCAPSEGNNQTSQILWGCYENQ